jgi:hypothetical protein
VNQNAQDRVFSSLHEIVKVRLSLCAWSVTRRRQFYYHMLKYPFNSTLAREAWFHGDLTSNEAEELLKVCTCACAAVRSLPPIITGQADWHVSVPLLVVQGLPGCLVRD